MLDVDLIEPPLLSMRDALDGDSFDELVADIESNGLLQPLTVCALPKEALNWEPDDPRWSEARIGKWRERYRLIAGWRRLNACRRAGLREVPCVVQATNDRGELEIMLRENLHREQPNAVAEGVVFATMLEQFRMTPASIAADVSRSESYVRSRLAVVYGPPEVREAVRTGQVSLSVASALNACKHDADRRRLLEHAISGGATAGMVTRWVAEAEQLRAFLPESADQTQPVVSEEAAPLPMGTCDICAGRVPFTVLTHPNVCPGCMHEWQQTLAAAAALARQSTEGSDAKAPGR